MKTQKQIVLMGLACLTFFIICITACKKNDSSNPDPIINTPTAKVTTTLSGRIVDAAGQPIMGATVEGAGTITTTDIMGLFLFKNVEVDKKRCSLKFTKAGYLNQYYSCIPSAGTVTYIKGVMLTQDGTYTITATAGGTVTLPTGASVVFPANAFSKLDGNVYSGTVTVNVTYLNPDDSMFRAKTPGRDLYALDKQGDEKVLVSYGMMNVELLSAANEKLQLTAGKLATITVPVAVSQMATAPASIPLWYFDETLGLWREQGTATKTGNQYLGIVSHFTWWNIDGVYGISYVSGKVISCDSTIQANIYVEPGYTTDGLGNFYGLYPAQYYTSVDFYSEILVNSNYISTQIETVPILATNQVYSVPHLVFLSNTTSMTNVTGRLVDCNLAGTDGFVVVTCTQLGTWNYLYVNDTFSLMLTPGYSYKITAINNGQYGQMTLNNLPGPTLCSSYNAGNLPICNSINTGATNLTMTLTSALLGTQSLSYFVDHCIKGVNTINSASQISLSATDTSNNAFAIMIMQVSNYAPGNYLWNNTTNTLYFSGNLNGIPVTVNGNLTGAGQNGIATAAAVGSNIVGSFDGPVTITSPSYPGVTIPGTLTGNFNVYRNQ